MKEKRKKKKKREKLETSFCAGKCETFNIFSIKK